MLNDNCPFSLWTVIVAAATISVHGGQLSLMDSYRCYKALFPSLQICFKESRLSSYCPFPSFCALLRLIFDSLEVSLG